MKVLWVRLRRSGEGFTLIELLVTSMLFVLVFMLVAGIMISALTAQRTVSTVSTSTTEAQFVASTIDDRIRNASEFQVTAQGADQLLVARVAGAGATLTWKCYGWYFSAANGGSIRMTTTDPGTKIIAPTSAQVATWTLLLTGVAPRTGSTIFTASGSQLAVAFNATAGTNKPVAIDFATARLTGVSEALTCY